MEDDPVISDVRDWLERNGYVLEMEVAQAVSQHATWTWQGESYSDPVTGKIREIDVWALWAQYPEGERPNHSLSLVFECKNTTAPWVLFTGSSEPDQWSPYGNFDNHCGVCQELDDEIAQLMRRWGPEAYSVTEKRHKVDGNRPGVDHAREAVQQAVSATVGKVGRGGRETGHLERVFSAIGVPVVVTRSPLVVCSLAADGKVELRQTDRASAEVLLPGEDEGTIESYGVFILHASALDDFLREVDEISTRFDALDNTVRRRRTRLTVPDSD